MPVMMIAAIRTESLYSSCLSDTVHTGGDTEYLFARRFNAFDEGTYFRETQQLRRNTA
jgi:hypothetical protein